MAWAWYSSMTANFNPRPHTGATPRAARRDGTAIIFQSTPPYGGDTLYACATAGCFDDFNPRPHTGATLYSSLRSLSALIFQSTPPYGGDTRAFLKIIFAVAYFNPRPHTGATQPVGRAGRMGQQFQSTPPYGGDTLEKSDLQRFLDVSIHAPIRGRHIEAVLIPCF